MTTTTVRIKTDTHALLIEMAQSKGLSIIDTLDLLLKEEATRQFFARMEETQKRVMDDPEARASRLEEIRAWDASPVDSGDLGCS